ncbi:hypothetical protein [Reinekea sp.]|jgi:hypothetical protein|uniref:hypothetical protein n=1 Tax=Reinekea sp. TaxID=1970455 RepID=UPI0039896414
MFAYLYAVFDLVSITLICLVVFKAIPQKTRNYLLIDKLTKTVIWHYYGILSALIVVSYLLGLTQLYELGYHYGSVMFIVPLMVYAIVKTNLVISMLVGLQLVIWLLSQHNYINLFDVMVGELLLICYLCMISVQLAMRAVRAIKTRVIHKA